MTRQRASVRPAQRAVVLAILSLSTIGLAACAGAPPGSTGIATGAASPEATATESVASAGPAERSPVLPAVGSVVGTGTFLDAVGSPVGSATITVDTRGALVLTTDPARLDRTGPGRWGLVLVPEERTAGDGCVDGPHGLSTGFTDRAEGAALSLPGDPAFSDLRFLKTLVLQWGPDDAPDGSAPCVWQNYASAALEWTAPDPRPWLETLVDSGIRPGAQGRPILESGLVVGYAVAPDDSLEAVTRRFGISEDDVHYLNPWRGGLPGGRSIVYADEVLNLDPHAR